MYGKLENDNLVYAPNYLIIGDSKVWNATLQEYLKKGWFPLVLTEAPEVDEHHYTVSYWEQEGNEIVQKWQVEEIEVTAEELLDILMGVQDDN